MQEIQDYLKNKGVSYTGMSVDQGDVIMRQINKLPEGLIKGASMILQPSETSGKAHKFKQNCKSVEVYHLNAEPVGGTITPNTGKFIVVTSDGAEMFHGKEFERETNPNTSTDHYALKVPPGIYHVDIAREYDYDRMESARVVD